MNNIPDGYTEITSKVTGIFVNAETGEIVITGIPDEDSENHNCDYMGCSSVSHVLYRCLVKCNGE